MAKELIVYVNEKGIPTGETAEKLAAHTANTRLHLAFSSYVFNEQGELLVTKRASVKKVWPNVWTNSACGHPAPKESFESAIIRRLDYELGMTVSDITNIIPSYTYKTHPYNGIIEHEFCPIFAARANAQPKPNPQEVDDFRWISWSGFIREAEADKSDIWSFWCKDQLKVLRENPLIRSFTTKVA